MARFENNIADSSGSFARRRRKIKQANELYKNYFALKTAAERYAKGRPHFQSFVIGKINEFLAVENLFESALDVGCGTGLSGAALKEIAETIVEIDVSSKMIDHASKTDGIEYVLASAENLPFGPNLFDLITISQAIHWVDKEKFFAEADRVLKPNSPIIGYDNYFQGEMLDNPAFDDWYRKEFLAEFPVPPRGQRSFAATSKNAKDFVLKHEEFNENTLEFSAEELVDYLVTISNVIARVENGIQTIEEVQQWLMESIGTFFDGARKKFAFINPIWHLRRNL